jgi:hypothetical protein
MATSDKEQKGIDVRYHARLAMGVKLDGTSLESKGGSKSSSHEGKKQGGLSHTHSKKHK